MNEISDKILPYEARAEFCQIFCPFFWAMEFQEKMLLRFTDLWMDFFLEKNKRTCPFIREVRVVQVIHIQKIPQKILKQNSTWQYFLKTFLRCRENQPLTKSLKGVNFFWPLNSAFLIC